MPHPRRPPATTDDATKVRAPRVSAATPSTVTTHHTLSDDLGDFTTTPRVLAIGALAVGIGALSAFIALALLRLIGLFTNLFFFGRVSTTLVSPAGNHLGLF